MASPTPPPAEVTGLDTHPLHFSSSISPAVETR